MGCVQSRPSFDSPPRGLEKLKLEKGYVGSRPPLVLKQLARISSHQKQRDEAAGAAADGGQTEGKVLSREEEEKGNGDRASQKMITVVKKSGGDELKDGWPRWLTDNVPVEALAGLVRKSADSYDKLAKIGQGTYSNVYKAIDRDTGKIVALKKVRFDTSESESVRFMAREITILRRLNHPNVIKLEGLATSRMQYSLYLVFDFMQSDLAKIISHPDRRLTEPQVKCYMQQLLAGLQHCHERRVLHRDIKGSNLLIDKNGTLKIADFGLAIYCKPNQKRPFTSRVVTLWYRAPELLLGSTDYGVGIDLWSVGCLLAEMFAGRPIMPGRTEVEQLHKIFKLCGSPPEDYWKKLKLTTGFRPQPYRPSLLETFKDLPASSLDLLSRLLALDPAHRGTATCALQSEFFSTSPLACGLSGLPVIYKGEDNELTQYHERRKNRSLKKKRSHASRERQNKKDPAKEKSRGNSGSSKEEEKSATTKSHSQEMGSSTGSTSSGVKPHSKGSTPLSLSPVARSLLKTSSARTECHPRGSRNIKNLPPLLPTTKTSIDGDKEDRDNIYRFSLNGRSTSTLDFRKLDPERIPTYYAFVD
ncbi:putative serine/threonine-protein kinase [Cinnamomum micranthum f. kanehirae]|uniref:Putative serine/threonine-protein kinase n=1 Tax=Cinnamomum micranthum f. kanehirae TaxID=337451 RepID=A0A3S3P4W3_9MAGN|nr:putative serine/threonine-protein kinase [Cinnamomum micranthum f. kanehirae]